MPSNDQPSKPERVRLSDARADIGNALSIVACHAADGYPADEAISKAREVRIMAFLDQCERVQAERDAALKACRVSVEAAAKGDFIGLGRGVDLARNAVALADD